MYLSIKNLSLFGVVGRKNFSFTYLGSLADETQVNRRKTSF